MELCTRVRSSSTHGPDSNCGGLCIAIELHTRGRRELRRPVHCINLPNLQTPRGWYSARALGVCTGACILRERPGGCARHARSGFAPGVYFAGTPQVGWPSSRMCCWRGARACDCGVGCSVTGGHGQFVTEVDVWVNWWQTCPWVHQVASGSRVWLGRLALRTRVRHASNT